METHETSLPARNESMRIVSGGDEYPAYLAAPASDVSLPAVVLIHSFRGLEPGYKTMIDMLASEGFVVMAPEWQNFSRTPGDDVVGQLISDSVAYLKSRKDVDNSSIGLTGFCAGGRYTMLFLPHMKDFKSGVAWYGFPYSRGFSNQSQPAEFVDQLSAPMLIIHGTHDQASNISDIYRYAIALNDSGKYFEMKVYQGQPHGFMIEDGQLSQSLPAKDAFQEMVSFFKRTLHQSEW
ncbi:MAG TPA: dienelactone hydrolase family protein [Methanotrichaceae archaeon]|nr:dienelactone hydrolase family protein [Methanotrichaceae archaeon]